MIGAYVAEKAQAASLLLVGLEKADSEALHSAFDHDYRVVEATGSNEALLALHAEVIDAVLINLNLPDCNELFNRIRGTRELSHPLLFAVVEDDEDSQVAAFDAGVKDVITTPVKPNLARARLKSTLVDQWSRTDQLTGLHSEEAFNHEAILRIAEKPAGTYLLACADVDNFKAINAQYDRETGDFVLQQVAEIVANFVDTHEGIACRVAADNFALLLPSGTPALLPEMMASLEGTFQNQNIHIKLQLSIGRYLIDDKTLSLAEMMNRALLAKRSVKGRYNVPVAYYNDDMQRSFMEEQRILSHMDYALAEGQFEVWLQPQYNHEIKTMIGAEALVRWRNPEHNEIVSPAVFVPVFERNGFIYELDKYVWEKTCGYLRSWLDKDIVPPPISVNVSRIDILQDDFYERITELVERNRIPVHLLRLEITESAFSFDTARIIAMVKKLQAYGFTIEIDDFGSGYSSFNVLKEVPADILKLDMRFLSGEDDTGRGGNIIESIVRMAKWIGMQIIAEGVETLEQADFLHSIGSPLVQGYLYDKPLPISEFERRLADLGIARNTHTPETVDVIDGNAFWNPESIETLVFNSYVGAACVAEFTERGCEIIRANEKFRDALCTDMPLADLLALDPLARALEDPTMHLLEQLRQAEKDGSELRGEIAFSPQTDLNREEHLRYHGRLIAQSPIRSVVYFLVENITVQKRAQAEVAKTTEQQRQAEQLVRETNEQLLFLSDISRYLLAGKDPDEAIHRALEKMLEHFDGERAYIFELDDTLKESANTYEVCAPGIASEQTNLQHLPYQAQDYVLKEFRSGHIVSIEDVNDTLATTGKEERSVLRQQGIRGVFLVPLWSGEKLIGYTGVDDPRRNTSHVSQLAALGDYMAAMLIRRDDRAHMKKDNELMQRLMNDTPGGFVRMKMLPGGRAYPVFINDGFCEIMGMNREEALELYTEDAYAGVHPDDIPELQKAAAKAMEEDSIFSARARFFHKEKGYLQFQAFYRTTTDADGCQYTNGYYVDVTAEVELEERRKELLDNLPCGAIIFEIGANGTIDSPHINKRYMELVGRHGDEVHTRNSIQAVHPEDRNRMMSAIDEAIRNDCDMECDIRTLKGGGGYVAFHLVGHIVEKEARKTIMYTTYTPISEETRSLSAALADQRRAEQIAQETNEQLRFLNDASRYLLTGNDPDDSIHDALRETMEYFSGDRAYIFESDEEKRETRNTYEVCAPNVASEKDSLQHVPYELQEYALDLLRGGRSIYLDGTGAISDSGIDVDQIITGQKIHRIILVPLRAGKQLVGFMGVDNPSRNASHVNHLMGLGDYMTTMLQRRDSEAQILRDNRIMRDLMNDMPGGFVQARIWPDGKTEPVFINEEFCRMCGMGHSECFEFYGGNGFTGIHPEDRSLAREALENMIATRETQTLRLRLTRGDGSYIPMQVFYRVTDDSAGNLLLNGYYTDLTDQLALEEREMAEHDELTGLFNRTKLAHMQTGEYQELSSCGVLFFDVNYLKDVNDTQGHDKGDELLRLVADCIHSLTNDRVHGYRYGGDEFIIAVCDGTQAELSELIEQWDERMRTLAKARGMAATAAVGSAWSAAPFTFDHLIHQADRAMYVDKQRSKQEME